MNAQSTADLLNEMVTLDKNAIQQLTMGAVPCNRALADHPTVLCRTMAENYFVGLLGILNGILLRDGDEIVKAVFNNEESAGEIGLARFEVAKYG